MVWQPHLPTFATVDDGVGNADARPEFLTAATRVVTAIPRRSLFNRPEVEPRRSGQSPGSRGADRPRPPSRDPPQR